MRTPLRLPLCCPRRISQLGSCSSHHTFHKRHSGNGNRLETVNSADKMCRLTSPGLESPVDCRIDGEYEAEQVQDQGDDHDCHRFVASHAIDVGAEQHARHYRWTCDQNCRPEGGNPFIRGALLQGFQDEFWGPALHLPIDNYPYLQEM